jgi:hypothetical protein
MSGLAEVMSSGWSSNARTAPRERELPTCAVCSDSMIAAEASAFADESVIYLWSCETCGYGFVTKHGLTQFQCN